MADAVELLAQQIANQRKNLNTESYWAGGAKDFFGGFSSLDMYMARDLVGRGITSLDQIGQKTEPVLVESGDKNQYVTGPAFYNFFNQNPRLSANTQVTYNGKPYYYTNVTTGYSTNWEGGFEPITEPALVPLVPGSEVKKTIINKNTGEPLIGYQQSHHMASPEMQQDGSFVWGGTYGGSGNTAFNIQFTPDGLPIFYTTSHSSSDFDPKDIAPMVAIASLMIPGLGQAVGSFIVEAALGTAAAQGMSAAALGAIGSGVLTTALTGDVKTGVLSAAGGYLGAQAGELLGNTASQIFESPLGKKFAESIGSAMTRAAVLGQSIEDAGLAAATGEMFNLAVNSVPGFSSADAKTRSLVTEAVQTALQAPGSLADKITAATLQGATSLAASQVKIDGKSFVDLKPEERSAITSLLGTVLSGKPLDQALINSAISKVQTEFAGALKQPTAAQPEDFGFGGEPTPAAQPEDFGFASLGRLDPLGAVPLSPLSPATAFPVGAPSALEGPPDMGPEIRREAFISDPNQPTREPVPGSIPGEVPMQRESVAGGDSLADLIEAESQKIVGGTTTPVAQLASSGQMATDAIEQPEVDRFRKALQPGHTQIWLQSEIDGLEAIVKKMRDAGISDDVIEQTLVNEQARNPEFTDLLRGSAVAPTEIGESLGQKTGDVTKTGDVDQQKAGVVSIGESVTSPETGGSTFFGKGAGESVGVIPFSVIGVDNGITTYDMGNGFSLFLFADGRQRIMDNENQTMIDVINLPKNIQDNIQVKIAEADAAKSAEALKVPVEQSAQSAVVSPTGTVSSTSENTATDKTNAVTGGFDTARTDVSKTSDLGTTAVSPASVSQPTVIDPITGMTTVNLGQVAPTGGLQSGDATVTQPAIVTETSSTDTSKTSDLGKPTDTTKVATDTTGATTVTPQTTVTTGLTEQDVTRIINDALLANPGLSEGDVKRIVGDALGKLPSGVSASDVKNIVDTAIGSLPKSFTAQDLTNVVNNATQGFVTVAQLNEAISGIKFPPGLSEQNVRDIFSQVMTENPGLSVNDVKRAINSALSLLPASASPSDLANVASAATSQIAGVESRLSDAIASNEASGLSRDAAITKSITDVASSLGITKDALLSQLGTSEQTLRSEFTSGLQSTQQQLSQQIQSQYDNLSASQKAEVAARVQQGQDLQTAITTVGEQTSRQIIDLQAEFRKAEEDRLKAEEEKRKLDEEARKAAEEASRTRSLFNVGSTMLGGAAGTLGALGALGGAGTPAALSPLRALTTGEATKEFVSPLAAFQKQIGLAQPETKPEERTMPYFSYGQPSEVANILGLQDEEESYVAKGGLITPMMASGGLPVVHYAGKPRIDYRRGAYVQGPGDGQSDDIPAMLADGEFVFPADIVAALGNGSNKAGADKLYQIMHNIRKHYRSAKPKDLPPPAKESPLSYLSKRVK